MNVLYPSQRSRLPVHGGHHRKAGIAENKFEDLEHSEFIIDDQYRLAGRVGLFLLSHPLQLIS